MLEFSIWCKHRSHVHLNSSINAFSVSSWSKYKMRWHNQMVYSHDSGWEICTIQILQILKPLRFKKKEKRKKDTDTVADTVAALGCTGHKCRNCTACGKEASKLLLTTGISDDPMLEAKTWFREANRWTRIQVPMHLSLAQIPVLSQAVPNFMNALKHSSIHRSLY